jgi:NitT/TauT family transport system substrate-binding protein
MILNFLGYNMRFPLTFVIAFVAFPSPTRAAPPTLRIGYNYWLPNVPLDIADTKGWWKEAGVAVELKRFENTQEVLRAWKGGEIDLATDMIGTWIDAINRGEDVVVLGETDWSHGGDKILVKASTNLAKLKGQPIAVYIRNLAIQHFLSEHLAQNKLALADYSVVEVSDEKKIAANFLSGKVQAMVLYEPLVTELAEKGNGRVVATTADYPGVMPEGFAARRSFYAEVPRETLVAFFRVWFRAVAYAVDPAHAKEVATLASETTLNKTTTIAPEDLAGELAKVPLHSPKRALRENSPGGNLDTFVRKAQGDLHRMGTFNAKVDIPAAVDTRALVEAATAAH